MVNTRNTHLLFKRVFGYFWIIGIGLGVLQVWSGRTEDHKPDQINFALETLNQVPTGRALLQKALLAWNLNHFSDLRGHFKWGGASRTDTLLTRQYDPKTKKESRQREITIYLRKNQAEFGMILDIAHELTHATSEPGFDPYDPGLTVGKYIHASLEGEGGEVDAVMSECQVGIELSDRFPDATSRCEEYLNFSKSGSSYSVSRDKILQDFYRVGEYEKDLRFKLSAEIQLFPKLSGERPHLYSSTGHAPYPVSLFEEFQELNERVCQNSRKRIDRSENPEQATRQFISKRCL